MIFNFPPVGGGSLPHFDYTGQYTITKSNGRWEIALLTSGTLTPRRPMLCDIFAVAAGRSGGNASVDGPNYYGGAGGYGGAAICRSHRGDDR